MSDSIDNLESGVPEHGPARDFYQYCREERRLRAGNDPDFDTEQFDEAVALVLRKLGALEAEGLK